jgi:hypothetical protein
MRRWLLPGAASGHDPVTPRQRGWKTVTMQVLIMGRCAACPDRALRERRDVRVQVSAGFVFGAGVKAETMTNNLPILSVYWAGLLFWSEININLLLIIAF